MCFSPNSPFRVSSIHIPLHHPHMPLQNKHTDDNDNDYTLLLLATSPKALPFEKMWVLPRRRRSTSVWHRVTHHPQLPDQPEKRESAQEWASNINLCDVLAGKSNTTTTTTTHDQQQNFPIASIYVNVNEPILVHKSTTPTIHRHADSIVDVVVPTHENNNNQH